LVAQPGFEPEYRRPERRRMPNYPTGPRKSIPKLGKKAV